MPFFRRKSPGDGSVANGTQYGMLSGFNSQRLSKGLIPSDCQWSCNVDFEQVNFTMAIEEYIQN